MSCQLIDRDSGREGESFEDGFFVVNFAEFLVDEAVGP